MATFAELKQQYLDIKAIGEQASDEARLIDNALGDLFERVAFSKVNADYQAQLDKLSADWTTTKNTFNAADWTGKMSALRQGINEFGEGTEGYESLNKLWGIENAYTPDILKTRKKNIDSQITNLTDRIAKLPRPAAPPTAPTTPPDSTATTSTSGAPLTPTQQTTLNSSTQPANSQPPTGGASEATAAGANSAGIPELSASARKAKENPLHAYASYTYGLSLHLLTIDDYNAIVENQEYVPKHVLVASAGRYNDVKTGATAFGRDPEFSDDFYFGSLNMTTVIGAGESNRATNAIDIKFTLIEPYGLTLLDRLLAASDAILSSNYLANPYLLQIDFFGTDDDGNVKHPIPNISKRIPINILAMNCKVTNQGSEYQITAQPYSHQAFNQSIVGTPVELEITASTVAAFFRSSTSGISAIQTQLAAQRAETDPTAPLLFTKTAAAGGSASGSGSINKEQIYTAKSYADALNAYMLNLELKNYVLLSDRYEFAFDSMIGDSPLYADSASASPWEAPMSDAAAYRNTLAGQPSGALNLKQRKFPIRQGTSIEGVISHLVRHSDYIMNQMVIREGKTAEQYAAEKKAAEGKTLDWFKIVPKIKLRGFDPFTNTFAKDITYHVIPYKMNNVRFEDAPQGKAKLGDASKLYDYIYTGLNNDIIDLNIEFNAMYYTAKTAYKSNMLAISGTDAYTDNTLANGDGSCDIAPSPKSTIMPNQVKYRHADQRQLAAGGSKTAQEFSAADLSSTIATQSGADMLQVDLKIIGDPDFIKQDDLFYQPSYGSNGEVENTSVTVTPNGSIKTDNGEIFVQLMFRTPVDINDTDGLMKFDSKYRASGFSGLYRVMTVESVFEAGKFIQNLHLIRYPNQEEELAKTDTRDETAGWSSERIAASSTPTDQVGTPPAEAEAVEDLNNSPAPEPATETGPTIDPGLADVAANGETVSITDATAQALIAPDFTPISVRGNQVPGEAAITQP